VLYIIKKLERDFCSVGVNALVCLFGTFNRIERDLCAVGVHAL